MSLPGSRAPSAMLRALTLLTTLAAVSSEDRATLHLSEGEDRPLALYNAPPTYDSGREHKTTILVANPSTTYSSRNVENIPVYSLDCQGKSRCSRTIHHRTIDATTPSPYSRDGRDRSLRNFYNDMWYNHLGGRALATPTFSDDYYFGRRTGDVSLSEPIDEYFNNTYLEKIMDKNPVRNSSEYDPFRFRPSEERGWPSHLSHVPSGYEGHPKRPLTSGLGLGPGFGQGNGLGQGPSYGQSHRPRPVQGEWVSLEQVPYTATQVSKWVSHRNDLPPHDRWSEDRPGSDSWPNRLSDRPGSYWGVANSGGGGARPTQHWNYEPSPSYPSSIVATPSPSYFSSWERRPYKHATIDKIPSPSSWSGGGNRRPTQSFNPSGSWHRPTLALPNSLKHQNHQNHHNKRPIAPTLYNNPMPYQDEGWDSPPAWDRPKPSASQWDQWADSSDQSAPMSASFWTRPNGAGGGSSMERPGYTQIETEEGGTRWVLLSSTKGGVDYSPARAFSDRSLSPPRSSMGNTIMNTRATIRLNVLPQVGFPDATSLPWPSNTPVTKWVVTRRPGWLGSSTTYSKPWDKPSGVSSVPIIKDNKKKPPGLIPWPNKPTQGLATPDYFEKLNATLQSLKPVRVRNRKKKPLNYTYISTKWKGEGGRGSGKLVDDLDLSMEERSNSDVAGSGRAMGDTTTTESSPSGAWVNWPASNVAPNYRQD